MTQELAEAVVAAVAAARPLFCPHGVRVVNDTAVVTFDPVEGDPRRVCDWFAKRGVVVVLVGRETHAEGDVMIAKFKQVRKS